MGNRLSNSSISIVGLTMKIKERWVQDAKIIDASLVIMKMTVENAKYIHNTGSKYVTGPSKSGSPDDVGIYFKDPTSDMELK